jgi:hypothetical protein
MKDLKTQVSQIQITLYIFMIELSFPISGKCSRKRYQPDMTSSFYKMLCKTYLFENMRIEQANYIIKRIY